MRSISKIWSQFALDLKYENIPHNAIYEAKRFLLDSIGCAIASINEQNLKAIYHYIKKLGGSSQASLIGYGDKTNLPLATLLNSMLIRGLDCNDIYWKQDPSHPSDIIPAALSCSEFAKKSGKELITAIVIAYELEIRMCNAAFPGIREIGLHHASLTQFVSPVVAGKLLDLSEDEIVSAIGISGSSHFTIGGVVAGSLTSMKNAADPLAVEAGVRAALMAKEGFSGPAEVFEGKEGLFDVINKVEWKKEELISDLGKKFFITQCGYKLFPTEALTHQAITAALDLVNDDNINSDDIQEVLIETTTRGVDILADPSKYKPTTRETADHSLPYCIAVVATKHRLLPSDFEAEALKDKKVLEMIKKVKVVPNSEIDALFPKVKRAIVTIKTSTGVFRKQEDFAKGQPERPLSDKDLIEKFKANASKVMPQSTIDKIINSTLNLEEFKDVSEYMKNLVKN